MSASVFAGVDPSIENTGVVALDDHGQVVGTCNTKTKVRKTSKTPNYDFLKLHGIADAVVGAIQAGRGKDARVFVAYEDYSLRSQNRPFRIGELGGVLKLALVQNFPVLKTVPPKSLKKFALHGNAGKEEIIAQARKECDFIAGLPEKECTDDLCDAYFLAKLSWYMFSAETALKNETYREQLRRRLEVCQKLKI